MAIRQGSEAYTMFVHVENGRPFNRRIHRLEIQARDGRIHHIEGDDLPDFIQVSTGTGHKGEHVGQILLNPKAVRVLPALERWPWPCWRDLVNFAIGFFAITMLRFIASMAGIG